MTNNAPGQPREVFPIQNTGVMVDETNSRSASFSRSSSSNNNNNESHQFDNDGGVCVDKELSAKLNQMSVEDRMKAIHELHGVAEIEEESTEMLESKLRDMTRVADSFGNTEKTAAYRKAMAVNKNYVEEKIKLMCLRADYYDVEKAAARMVSFFTFKLSLFGEDKLTRDIVLDDFQGEDRLALDNGIFQLLQQRDRSGRGITLLMGTKTPLYDVQAVLRVYYYVHMQALRDEEIQKKGIVVVFYAIGKKNFVSDRPSKFADMWWYLPLRLVAVHMCYDQSVMDVCVRMTSQAMEAHQLCRFRIHKGSDLECIFNLMTFGIPKDVFPKPLDNGDLDLEAHHKWLETVATRERLELENKNRKPRNYMPAAKEVVVPGQMDIVLGLGRQSPSVTVGYMKFRDVLVDHREMYENADRFEKTIVANLLFKKLRDAGCRFVRCTKDGLLTECTDIQARDKISHAFRNMRQQKTVRSGREIGKTKRPMPAAGKG